MRVLVTGANGQVGSEVAALVSALPHHDLISMSRPEFDITNRDSVLGLVTSSSPDLIVHCAAMTAVDLCESEVERAYLTNATATRFISDGARRVGAHVVYVSTDYVFDGEQSDPYVEWDSPNPQSVYGRSKLAGESEIDPAWTIARTSWVCGFHGNNMVKTLLRLAGSGDQVSFVDDQIGHPTFAADLAAMLLKAGVERVPGIFHMTNQGAVSWFDFARAVYEINGSDPDLVSPIKTSELVPERPAKRPSNSVLDNMAWRQHGFKPSRHFSEPLRELIQRLKA